MEDDLGNLIEEPNLANKFEPLRCPCSDENDAMTSMLEQTFRMVILKNNTLVSCCHETAMQWEITENTVQLVRCVIKPGSSWLITNLISLENGTHFLICQADGALSKISLHSIDVHAAIYELILNHLTVEVIPLSLDYFLDLQQSDLCVYSMKKPGHCMPVNMMDRGYLCMKKLPGVDNMVILLYEQYLDLWSITDQVCSVVHHYEFQTVHPAVDMEIIDSTKIIIMSEQSGLQAETLLCIRHLEVVSETPIPDKIEGDFVCPFSNSTVITLTPGHDRMGQYVENYMIHSLVKNKSCKFAVGLYADERYALFCHMFPSTLQIIVFTTHAKFFKCKISQDLVSQIKYAELRKNARILAQAHRTLTSGFRFVPVEICLKIISLTDLSIPEEKARRIAALYFSEPNYECFDEVKYI